MTHHADSQSAPNSIESRRVADSARIRTLPRHFGPHMMTVERKIYALMREFVPEYSGGYWHFYDLSNGGFYMAPEHDVVILSIPENRFNGRMTGDAAGITVCLFAFSHLSFMYDDDVFAFLHREAPMIFAAID